MKNVYLAASVRTPIGRFGGTLASWSAADLGVAVAKASLEHARLRPDQIQQSIWGCARQAGGGPNVARQITYRAGAPETVPAFTVNQTCGSGLQGHHPGGAASRARTRRSSACRRHGKHVQGALFRRGRAGACVWETPN